MSHFQACLNCVNTGHSDAVKNFPRCSKIPVTVCKSSQDGVVVSSSVSCFKGPRFKVEEFPCLVHKLSVILFPSYASNLGRCLPAYHDNYSSEHAARGRMAVAHCLVSSVFQRLMEYKNTYVFCSMSAGCFIHIHSFGPVQNSF